MTDFKDLSNSQKIRATLHREVLNICMEACHCLGLDVTRPAIAIIAELVYRKILIYGPDLEAFAKHAKRSTINQEDVKLLARRNNSLVEHLNRLCKNPTKSTVKEKRRKTTLPFVKPATTAKNEEEETQAKKKTLSSDEEFNAPGPSKRPKHMTDVDTIDLTL